MCIVCPVSYSHYTVAVTPPYHVTNNQRKVIFYH